MPPEQLAEKLRMVLRLAKAKLRPRWKSHPAVSKPRDWKDQEKRRRARMIEEQRRAEDTERARTLASVDQVLPRLREMQKDIKALLAGEIDWLDLDALNKELDRIVTVDLGATIFRIGEP